MLKSLNRLAHKFVPLAQKSAREFSRYRNMHGGYKLINRSKSSSHLLLIVAGYAPSLWPLTLGRVARFQMEDMDVCVVSPGIYVEELESICKQNGWSYLSSSANQIGLAQNLAIRAHLSADWIFKIDEDIFVTEDYFENLLSGFCKAEKSGEYKVGFAAPILNINGNTYIDLLDAVGKSMDYSLRFGELTRAANGIKAHKDGAAAKYLWEVSLPLDEVAAQIRNRGFSYRIIPHRFSIGAILIKRSFWNEINGFRRAFLDGTLGVEEEHLCKDCVELSRVMISVQNVFAGHFAFGPQRKAMGEMLPFIERDSQRSLRREMLVETVSNVTAG